MATLSALTVGDSATPNGWTSAPNGNLGDDLDSTYGYDDTNTTGAYDQGWALGNVDADFGNMDTLNVVLRYKRSANNANKTWDNLQCRVVNGATILAANTSGGAFETVASNITTTSATDSSSTGFTWVNTTADKTTWDGATVEIRINITREKGGNSDQFQVLEADFTGTYTVAPPTITDVETDEDFRDGDTAVTITGTQFEATQGTGKVELSDNAVYATGTKVAQTVTSWGDTSIDFTAVLSTLTPGTLWIWVTNNTGDRNAAFTVSVHRKVAFNLSASANIAASGENTTAQLTAPSGKTTGDFVAGRIQDDENPADAVNVTADDYTEMEWSIEATTDAADAGVYQFRIYDSTADAAIATYTVDPRWTIGGGQTIAVGIASESETPQTATGIKTGTVQAGVETEAAQPVTGIKTITVTGVTETEAAQVIAALKPIVQPVTVVTETETAQAVTVLAPIVQPVTLTTETEAPQPVSAAKTIPVTLITESETTQAVAAQKTAQIAVTVETETAQVVSGSKTATVGLTTESEAAQSILAPMLKAITAALEVEAGQPINASKTGTVTAVTETETAQTVLKPITVTVTATTETEVAQAVALVTGIAVNLASETEAAQTVTPVKPITVAVLTGVETETAQPVPASKTGTVTAATETEAAQPVPALKVAAVGTVTETELAQLVSAGNTVAVVAASETELGQAIAALKQAAVTVATETETGQSVTARKTGTVTATTETETAQTTQPSKSAPIGAVSETELPQTVSAGKAAAVTGALETETAQLVSPGKSVTLNAATETELARLVSLIQPDLVAVGIASETETAQTIVGSIVYFVGGGYVIGLIVKQAAVGSTVNQTAHGSVIVQETVGSILEPA